ncbi:hypothetical protein, partial [Ruminococcus callidus]
SSIFPKYLGKYARKMRAGRYETGSDGKFASRWRAKSPDALCAVLTSVSFSTRLFGRTTSKVLAIRQGSNAQLKQLYHKFSRLASWFPLFYIDKL